MAKMVAVTDKIHGLVAAETAKLGMNSMEGLAHAILMFGLTDPAFLAKAAAMSRYLGDNGSTTLEKMGH
jgi:hypothetical protein